ncbi:MAG: hypothetical protein WBA45_16400 [Microthrixaceae bacterium]
MTEFESDRPEGYDEKRHKYPYIRPEDLKPSERLAIDADAVEDFIEHFEHHSDHVKTHPRHHEAADDSDPGASEPESETA